MRESSSESGEWIYDVEEENDSDSPSEKGCEEKDKQESVIAAAVMCDSPATQKVLNILKYESWVENVCWQGFEMY